MKRGLFIDTWGWVTIHNKREPRHGEINAFYRRHKGDRLLLPDP